MKNEHVEMWHNYLSRLSSINYDKPLSHVGP